jgi:hypothetical protein
VPSGRDQRLVRCLLVGLLVTVAIGPGARDASSTSETSPSMVQAGFLTKFPLFVTWPDGHWQPGRGDLTIGVIGTTPVHGDLVRVASYTSIDGSAIEVRRIDDLSGMTDCEIVYLAPDEVDRLDAVLAALARRPILLVGASPGLAERGAHVNFYIDDGRVRFEINQQACERAGLGLSFRLRNVARIVE